MANAREAAEEAMALAEGLLHELGLPSMEPQTRALIVAEMEKNPATIPYFLKSFPERALEESEKRSQP